MDDDTILTTKRLRLRYQRESDIPFLIELWTDEEMTRYTGGPRERAFLLSEFGKAARDPRAEEYDLWVLESLETGELAGQAGFIPKSVDGEELIELNYFIRREDWGKGYATEISRALISHAFEAKKLDRLIALVDEGNEASKRVAQGAGMRYWKTVARESGRKRVYKVER